jgi:hypothetical protein
VLLVNILAEFVSDATQCRDLVANAHRQEPGGAWLLPERDRQQITVAALLNLFIAWESFLEKSLLSFMTGNATISGALPVRYVVPPSRDAASTLLTGINRYFDFGNHENVRKIVSMYFLGGSPYLPHLNLIFSDLNDIRTMRNASAHISSSTQTGLESLAQRVLGTPQPGIRLYTLLTAIDPRETSGVTVFRVYEDKLSIVATLIANG